MGILGQVDLKATSIAFEELAIGMFDAERDNALLSLFCDAGTTSQQIATAHAIESLPVMRQWIDDMPHEDLRYSRVSAAVSVWKKVLELKRLDAELLEASGLFARIAQHFSTPQEYERIVFNAMLANPTGYDGVALFSASHPRGPGGTTQSNTSTTALDLAQHRAVLAAGSSLAQANGEPFMIQYDTLMVGPALAATAREVTKSDVGRVVSVSSTGAESGTRVAAAGLQRNVAGLQIFEGGELRVVVNPRMIGTHANKYIYLDTSKPGSKPMALRVYGERSYSLTDVDSPARVARDAYQWGAEADLAVMPAAWQCAYLGAP